MALKIARRALVPPFIVMDVLRAANEREAAGEEVLHLEVGQPGTPAPAPVRAAAKAALETAKIGYTDALGLRSLRARIARSYADGSSGGFLLSFLASFEPGDRVALAAPGYPAYRNILASLGVEPVLLPCDLEHRFQPTVELLDRVAAPLDGLILASPSNPTGTMLERDALCDL
jgi:aspartate/methionine/tyrosine aminotransferase